MAVAVAVVKGATWLCSTVVVVVRVLANDDGV